MAIQDLRGAAYHEAGHAIVAWALDLTIGAIQIGISGDPAAGKVEIACAEKLKLIDQLAICLAGSEAQNIFDTPTHVHSAFYDYAKADKMVEHLDEECALELRNEARKRAHDLLQKHRNKVIRIAEYLARHRAANQETVRSLLA